MIISHEDMLAMEANIQLNRLQTFLQVRCLSQRVSAYFLEKKVQEGRCS